MSSLDLLFEAALAVQAKAYAPYSRFKVGAAIRTPNGGVFVGCNVEIAAYPEGSCAETAADLGDGRGGATRIARWSSWATAMGSSPRAAAAVSASASSRQARRHPRRRAGIRRIDELLPFSFGPDNLSA